MRKIDRQPPLSALDGFVYGGGLVAEAGLMSWLGDFIWPENVGPFEELFRVAEFGGMFCTGPIANTLLWVASIFGVGLQDLGRKIDEFLGMHSLKDLAGKNPKDIVAQLVGMPAEALDRMQKAGSFTAAASFDQLIIESRLIHKFAKDPQKMTKEEWDRLHEEQQMEQGRQPAQTRVRTQQEWQEEIRRRKENEFNRERAEHAEKPGLLERTFTPQVSGEAGLGLFRSAINKMKSGGLKGKVIGLLLIAVSWVIATVGYMVEHPINSVTRAAKTAGEMVGEGFTRDTLANPMGLQRGSEAQKQVDQNREHVFPKEPKSFKQEAAIYVDSIMAEGL